MTTELNSKQFEILPREDAAAGFVFGIGAEVSVDDGGFTPGTTDWLTQDSQNTRRGSNAFGRDVLTGPTWGWSSHVNRDDEDEALDTLERFSSAWRPVDLMETPGAVTALRFKVGQRTRRIYGRPRRFDAPPTNLIDSGYVPVTHDFQAFDAFTYDDVASSTVLTLDSASEGGFILPATMPIQTLPVATSAELQVAIGGTARAYPVVRFHGPWSNPTLITDNWTLSLNTSIAAGDWIEVDTRAWNLGAIRKDGSSAAGTFSRRTWLEDIYFQPGSRPNLRLGGSSSTGGATCTVEWRNTWNSI